MVRIIFSCKLNNMRVLIQFFLSALFFSGIIFMNGCKNAGSAVTASVAIEKYQCIPCGFDCDKEIFDAPGTCPHCKMVLVKQSTIHINSLPPENICAYISQHPGLIILDVRTADEFAGKADPDFGSLKGAINIPVQMLESRIAELNAYKEKDILVYCSHSHRSPRATYILSQNGFTKATNLLGGMSVVTDSTCKQTR